MALSTTKKRRFASRVLDPNRPFTCVASEPSRRHLPLRVRIAVAAEEVFAPKRANVGIGPVPVGNGHRCVDLLKLELELLQENAMPRPESRRLVAPALLVAHHHHHRVEVHLHEVVVATAIRVSGMHRARLILQRDQRRDERLLLRDRECLLVLTSPHALPLLVGSKPR